MKEKFNSSELVSESIKLTEKEKNELIHDSEEVLRDNRIEISTKPAPLLYPHQWLWDSCFHAIGLAYFDPAFARKEIKSLMKGQWKNGFLPHIIFDPKASGYSPNAQYWETKNSPFVTDEKDERDEHSIIKTSGITQPPLVAIAANDIYLREKDREEAKEFLKEIYPKIFLYHKYLFEKRDPEKSGLVSIYHPWESGIDNSPRWREVMDKINITTKEVEEAALIRQNVKKVKDPTMRPTNEDYARYNKLVRFMSNNNYDDDKIYKNIPFNIKDVMFNSILFASNEHLLSMAKELKNQTKDEDLKDKIDGQISEIDAWIKNQKQGFEKLYDKKSGLYYDLDSKTGILIKRNTMACFIPIFAGIPSQGRVEKMLKTINSEDFIKPGSMYSLIPSVARSDPDFNHMAYWRGPIWINYNWLIARGLERYYFEKEAQQIKDSILRIIKDKGFYEYFDSETYEGYGTNHFSWTAALARDVIGDQGHWKTFLKSTKNHS